MRLLLLALGYLLSCAFAQNSTASPSTQDATAFALLYGYPLLSFTRLASLLVPGLGVNKIFHVRAVSTASSTAVVKPNVDSLYSTAIFDLSETDVSLTVPNVPSSQSALFSFYDPYGDNFVNLGTGNFDTPGRYLLRNRGDRQYGVKPLGSNSTGDDYVAYLDSPSTYGILLVRMLVNATNLDAVHGYQDQTLVENASRENSSTFGPTLKSLNYKVDNTTSPALNVLRLLAQFAPYNQPETNSNVSYVQTQLQAAGISNRTFTLASGVDLDAANSTALASVAAAIADPSNSVELNNGWSITQPAVSGNFQNGSNFAYRAAVGFSGYLMLEAPNAVYPSWTNSSDEGAAFGSSQYYLGPNDAWIYTFSGKPPLLETGFWSLTAYADNFLIPNPANVFEIGDRSNFTYPDGNRVYGAHATGQDGVFQVLVQTADNPPPQNWTANWLPGPAGGGNMTALLRWYGAQDVLLDSTYVYPIVSKQSAIAATANGTVGGTSPSNASQPTSTSSNGLSSPTASATGSASSTPASTGAAGRNGVIGWTLSGLVALSMYALAL